MCGSPVETLTKILVEPETVESETADAGACLHRTCPKISLSTSLTVVTHNVIESPTSQFVRISDETQTEGVVGRSQLGEVKRIILRLTRLMCRLLQQAYISLEPPREA